MISPSERRKGMDDALKNREAWSVILESTSALVIVVLALVGNIFLCLAIYRFRTRRKIEHYYIFALTISDFLLALLCVVIAFVVTIIGHWLFGETVCQIQGALIYFSACFSLLNLSLIALNRYFKIVKSASTYQKIYTRRMFWYQSRQAQYFLHFLLFHLAHRNSVFMLVKWTALFARAEIKTHCRLFLSRTLSCSS